MPTLENSLLPMYFLDAVLPSLAENLALDEALLMHAEAGGPEVLRLWEWPHHAVVLGAGGRIADDVHEEACLTDRVPIQRRSSGGGTVLLGSGCLLFSLVLRFGRDDALTDLHASYRYILEPIARALGAHGSAVSMQGSSDLALDGCKFSGNSQQRKKTHLLHHGTLLYAFDLTAVPRYLQAPARQPAYRERRSHADFLMNVPIAGEDLRAALRETWQANDVLTNGPDELVRHLVQEKYERVEWLGRR